jgi:DNA-binding NarL/FixJ family response regulator
MRLPAAQAIQGAVPNKPRGGRLELPTDTSAGANLNVLVVGCSQRAIESIARVVDEQPAMAATRARMDAGNRSRLRELTVAPDVVALSLSQVGHDHVIDTVETVRDSFPGVGILAMARRLQVDASYLMGAGARGMLAGSVTESTLVAALQLVADGRVVMELSEPRSASERNPFQDRIVGGDPPPLERLTDRERDVYRGLVGGQTNAEIARDLRIATSTVKTHIERILKKLRVRDRKRAIIMAHDSMSGMS